MFSPLVIYGNEAPKLTRSGKVTVMSREETNKQLTMFTESCLVALCMFIIMCSIVCRRDYESRPLKLRLLSEIRAYHHRKDLTWVAEPDAPIDYCYVRPNHIPSVNSMCQEIFWPGNHHFIVSDFVSN